VSDRYEAQVVAALDALGVRPHGAFVWFGRRVAVPGDDALVQAIARRLLADFYEPGMPRPAPRDAAAPAAEAGAFGRALSQANCGRGSWQPGWRVAAVEEEATAVVRPDGLVLLAPAEDCRIEGALADVRLPKDLAGLLPGILLVLGDAPAPPPGEQALVRLCWSVAAAGAVTFVARVTYALNRAGLPFTLELLDDPARYAGRPGGELLLARTDFDAAMALLRPLLRALGPHLSDGAPAFTKPVHRGLAVAEEPDGERFGEHRCRLLAEAMIAADARGLRGADERLGAVRERFAAAGLGLDAPYLQPGSVDAYDGS
jgi:hypothetical protein